MDEPKRPRRTWLKYTLLSFLGILVIAIGAFIWWGLTPLGPSEEALGALASDETVTVTHTNASWVFTPKTTPPTTGYIFYPGGHVDARSYALYARDVAVHGYLVVIPEMPLSLAVFGIQHANNVIQDYPKIQRWVIGGHSLGGAMACSYAASNPGKVQGLVLLAAYPASGTNLSSSGLRVASLVGTLDTVVNRNGLESGRTLLPGSTDYITLEGGNHAQFGSYGKQPGDTPDPTMSAAEQRKNAVTETIAVLEGK